MSESHLDNKRQEANDFVSTGLTFDSIVRTPSYFGPQDKQLLGWLHMATDRPQSNTGVIICPPLAVEYMSTYRAMRYVCDYFALAGIPALRFDYHGTGDSSGDNKDENRLNDWIWSIEQACNQLKSITNCNQVGLFGLRMGATFAAIAAEKTEVDFLVLWAALENGRKYVREIRAIQMTGSSQASSESDFIEAGGSVLWNDTVDAIERIKLLGVKPKAKRILIIPRDDFKSNQKLKTSWEEQGLSVHQSELPGYKKMMELAYYSIVPHGSINKIIDWVKADVRSENNQRIPGMPEIPIINRSEMQHHNDCIKDDALSKFSFKERIVRFAPDKSRFGILSGPAVTPDPSLPIVLIANSGSNHRVGPSRLYVLIARELAKYGFRSLRFDIRGLGDSNTPGSNNENEEYINESNDEILMAMQTFGDSYKDNKYVLMGLCSGAYFSFIAALKMKDVQIIDSILINPLTFHWFEGMEYDASPAKNFSYWSWYKKAIRDPKSWLKLFRGRINFSTLFGTMVNRLKIVIAGKARRNLPSVRSSNVSSNKMEKQDLAADLAAISAQKRKLTLVLSRCDPGFDILMTSAGRTAKQFIKNKEIVIKFIENADHTFSKHKPRCSALNTIVDHIKMEYLNGNTNQ